ncbi:hypothetical protein CLV58_14110 [Spirosoma oryzae]|uniref:Gliding motility-associated-like protein n=1 Tax=Spirosoma oryzae TaxID=1469603 RepID=A0A2T0RQM1_9BACT|nr:Ig-like domain-containing protein [Spirosoma oryzae]PRY23489.1 hypothetical protein CLV58_14110 [Spirosoma oryzae]
MFNSLGFRLRPGTSRKSLQPPDRCLQSHRTKFTINRRAGRAVSRHMLGSVALMLLSAIVSLGQGVRLDVTTLSVNSTFIAGYYRQCNVNDVDILVNGNVVTPTGFGFTGYGLFQATVPYGSLPLGATVQLRENCTGYLSNTGTVRDEFAYVEVSGAASNGITPASTGSPYSALRTPTQILPKGCGAVTLGGHSDFTISMSLEDKNSVFGPIKINGQTPNNGDFLLFSPDESNPAPVFAANQTTASAKYTTALTNTQFVGPTTLTYTHNGSFATQDLSFRMGPVGITQITYANGQLEYGYYTTGNYNDKIAATSSNPNGAFELIFDGSTFTIKLDGSVIASVARSIQFNPSIGTVSNGGVLPYGSTVTYEGPTSGGSGYIEVIYDGYQKARQLITVNGTTTPPSIAFASGSTSEQICVGSSATLNATGCTGIVTWSTGATGNSLTITPGVGLTTYTATCTENGCSSGASNQAIVSANATPAAPALTASPNPICAGSISTLNATGCNGTVTWSTGATGASISVSPNQTTTYTATCTENGCTSPQGSVGVTVNPIPAAPALTASPSAICVGSASTLNATGCTDTVTWSTGATGASISVSPNQTTTYTATCTENGCTSAAGSVGVTVNPGPSAPALTASPSAICVGSASTLTATGCTGTVTWSTGTTGASISVSPNQTTTYTATCTENGCTSPQGSVGVTVNPIPVAPTATPASLTVYQYSAAKTVSFGGCAGTIDWSGTNGTTGTGSISLPTASVGTITYTATCTENGCTSPAVSMLYEVRVNPAPTTTNDATTTQPNTPVQLSILTNDTDGMGNGATLQNVTLPTITVQSTHGTVVVNADGTATYTPANNFAGTDQFTYQICSPLDNSKCATAVATISVVSSPPVAVADASSTGFNTPVTTTILSNDKDRTGAAATLQNVTLPTVTVQPAHGTVVVTADGTATYTPTTNYAGPDQYTYQICDVADNTKCSTAVATITIASAPPVAVADISTTGFNTPVITTVLSNDKDKTGAGATLQNVTLPTVTVQPAHGSTTINANGTIVYTPTLNFTGQDQYTYQICDVADNTKCVTALVTVTVGSTPPVAANDQQVVAFNTPTGVSLLSNDTDKTGAVATLQNVTMPTVTSQPAHGSVVVNPDGTATYTPATNYVGQDAFSYQICDIADNSKCATAVATISVVSSPPVAVADASSTGFNTPVTTTILSNDKDRTGAAATLQNVTLPTVTVQPAHGTVVVNADGTATYTPAANYAGPDQYTYQICDVVDKSKCATAIVTINVSSAPPVANSDNAATGMTQPITVNILGNDNDKTGSATTLQNVTLPVITTQPTAGTAIVNPDGTITYTPNGTFAGSISFPYQICDVADKSLCATATVTINLGVDSPTITADKKLICAGTSATLTATGCKGTVTWSTGATGNSIGVNPTATTTYTATCSVNGVSSQPSVPIGIQVTPLPQAPVIYINNAQVNVGGSATICSGTSVTLVATGCAGTVTWSTGDVGASLVVTPQAQTDYTAVCSINGCVSPTSNRATALVTEIPAAPMVTGGGQSICLGQSVQLSAQACTGRISWSGGQTGSTITVSPTTSTSYRAYCTVNNCISPASSELIVTVNPVPSAPRVVFVADEQDKGEQLSVCAGTTLKVVALGCQGGTLRWNDGSTGVFKLVTAVTSTDYSVVCINAGGCQSGASNTARLNVISLPDAPRLDQSAPAICAGSSATLTAYVSADVQLRWSTGDTANVITIMPALTTTYTVQAFQQGCAGGVASLTVSVNQLPSSPQLTFADSASTRPGAICAGGSVTLVAAGSCSGAILWSDGSKGSVLVARPLQTTLYTAVCVSAAGCSSPLSNTLTAVVTPLPGKPTLVAPRLTMCAGDTIRLSVSALPAGMKPIWSTGDTTSVITLTKAGKFAVAFSDVVGCQSAYSDTASISVLQSPAKPVLAMANVMDVQVMDDSIPSPYVYRWFLDGNRDVTAGGLGYRAAHNGLVVAERRAEYYFPIPNTNPVVYDTLVCPVRSSIKVESENDLVIFPNPTTGPISVVARGQMQLDAIRVRLWDELGREIFTGYTQTLANGKLVIDLTYLPDAMYTMQLYSDSYRNTWKVIKLSQK